MKLKHFFILFLVMFFSFASVVSAAENAGGRRVRDSIRVSLVTCDPGKEIYALFGHTAIHVTDETTGMDLAFNYGMFNFRSENFIYRFVKGETDYELGLQDWTDFKASYKARGITVYEQVLNMSYAEKMELCRILFENYKPENRIYRYNYFYDNCTTRARDMIERSIPGGLNYDCRWERKTYRQVVHEFTAPSPWVELGIDFCLGAEADRKLDEREQMFIPSYLMDAFSRATAKIDGRGELVPVVKSEEIAVEVVPEDDWQFPVSPLVFFWIFFGVGVVLFVVQLVSKRIFWGYDVLLLCLQGLAGILVAYLFFFSIHPTVGSNWLVMIFNPVPLVWLPFMVYRSNRHKRDVLHAVNVAVLCLFILLMPVIPQDFNNAVLPMALILLLQSSVHLLLRPENRLKSVERKFGNIVRDTKNKLYNKGKQ